MKKIKFLNKKDKSKSTKSTSRTKKRKGTIEKESKGHKTSNLFKIILAVIALIIFVVCYFLFGFVLALLALAAFLIMLLFTLTLDNNPKKSKKRKIIKFIFIAALVLGIIGICCFIIFFTYVVINAPEFDVSKLERKETSVVYDSNNEEITKLGSQKREKITYDQMPEVLVDAIVATEDSRYFQHNGFDAPRFFKAALGQLLGRSDAGGGSTITMQVSKNSLTSFEDEGFEGILRKFTDIYISIFKLEKAYTKQEILEFYVNTPFLGSNSYGIEQASQTYFGKSASDLNLAEASIIAGLFQAPGLYDPYVNPDETTARRDTVLSLMVTHGYITEEEKAIAEQIPVEDLLQEGGGSSEVSEFQGYIDTVLAEIENKTGLDPYEVPMKIYTNMDREKQTALNKVFNGETYDWPNDSIEGGVVAVDTNSGKIIAVGAGRNKTAARTYNFATEIKRQIGSTAKPLFDYGPGIEYNNWSTGTTFVDEPYTYSDGTPLKNFNNRYYGAGTLRYMLRNSLNIPAVKAFQSVDNEKIKEFVTTLGIEPEIDANGKLHEAHALGAFNGASPLQLAAAYAAFANGGYYYEPYTVNKIILRETEEVLEFESGRVQAMSDSTAYMITDILRGVAIDTGVKGAIKTDVAVKTGTTNYYDATLKEYNYPSSATPDGWIAGYTPNISMAMWTGFEYNEKGVYLTQSQMVTQRNGLYRACAKAVFDSNGPSFEKPDSVIWQTVEKNSDPLALPSENTPSDQKITELFKKGTEPTEVSSKYNQLDDVTGLSVSQNGNTAKLTWNSVNPPTDIKEDYGTFGYKIYLNDTYLGFTDKNYFTYTADDIYGTYTVITCYSDSNNNMSSGVKIVLETNIIFEFNDDTDVTLSVGEVYTETDPAILVYENLIDVTSSASITRSIKDLNTGQTVTTIDTLKAGKYEVTYTATYKGKSKSFIKTVTIIE